MGADPLGHADEGVPPFRLNLNQWSGWNFGGDHRFAGTNVNAHIVLNSNWAAGAGFNVEVAGIDDRSTRGGPGVPVQAAAATSGTT